MKQILSTRRECLTSLFFTAALLLIATVPSRAQAPAAKPAPAVGPAAAATTVAPKVEKQDSFYVIGFTVHTTVAAESKGDGQIPALWQRFLGTGATEIPAKVDDDVYAIYSDYSPDQSFSYTLGAHVTSIDKVPAGMAALTIPAGRYAVIPSAVGPLQEVVPAMWQKIWMMSPAELGGKRSMKYDYNVLNMQGIDPQNAQVDAYVGLE